MQAKLQVATSGTVSGLTHAQTVNSALAAMASRQGGATSPSDASTGLASIAGLEWLDTGSGTSWLRDQADSTFYATGSFDEVNKRYLAVATPIYGLMLSAAGSTLGIAAGACIADTADSVIIMPQSVTKSLTGFGAGSGQGALDAGTLANNAWYHVYAIKNPVNGATDILLSASATTPNLPANYTRKALLGAAYINSSGTITPFTQHGNKFIFTTGFQDVNYTGASTTPTLKTLTVPGGLKVEASFRAAINNGAGGVLGILFQSPDEAAEIIGVGASGGNCSMQVQLNNGLCAGEFLVRTNTSSQITVTSNSNSGASAYSVYTTGFTYPRGLT